MKVPYGSLCPYVTPLTGRCTWKRHLSVGGLLPCSYRVTRSLKLQPLLSQMKVPQVHKWRIKLRRQNRCSKVGTHQTRRVNKCQLSGGSMVLATLLYKMLGVQSGSTERTR